MQDRIALAGRAFEPHLIRKTGTTRTDGGDAYPKNVVIRRFGKKRLDGRDRAWCQVEDGSLLCYLFPSKLFANPTPTDLAGFS